jgi:nifR3 family TIM-barrel protein
MEISPDEHPVGIQLFGRNPEDFSAAVPLAEQVGADLIDLNFGCPVPKVAKQGGGSALMKEPEQIKTILRATVKAATVPVTAKFRSGWDAASINVVELCKMAEGEGVSAVCVHPRTRSQGFSGTADWQWVKAVKDAVKIPVIGSGDIVTRDDAVQRMAETGCDAVMIGRHAVQFFIPVEQRSERLRHHLRQFAAYRGEGHLVEMRKFVVMYTKGMPGASQFRQRANVAHTLAEFEAAI